MQVRNTQSRPVVETSAAGFTSTTLTAPQMVWSNDKAECVA